MSKPLPESQKLAASVEALAALDVQVEKAQQEHTRLLDATRGSTAASDLAYLEASRGRLATLEARRRDQAQLVDADRQRADEAERALAASEQSKAWDQRDISAREPIALAKGLQELLDEVAADVAEYIEARERVYAAIPPAQRPGNWPAFTTGAAVLSAVEAHLYAATNGLLCRHGQSLTPYSVSQRPGLDEQAAAFAEYVQSRRGAA